MSKDGAKADAPGQKNATRPPGQQEALTDVRPPAVLRLRHRRKLKIPPRLTSRWAPSIFRSAGPLGQHLRRVDVEGTSLAFEDSLGSGPPVLLLPAEGDLRQEYRLVAPLLREDGFRVVVQDLRGFGDSSRWDGPFDLETLGRDALAVLDKAGIERAVVVGCSRTAAVAVWLAVHAPQRVEQLVLISPLLRDSEHPRLHRWWNQTVWNRPFGAWLWAFTYVRRLLAAPPADVDDYRNRLLAHGQDPGRTGALRGLHQMSVAQAWELLPRVEQPTLVVVGGRDRLLENPSQLAEDIRARLGGPARTFVFHGLGHYPQVERPHLSALRIVTFYRALRRSTLASSPTPMPARWMHPSDPRPGPTT